MNLQNLQENSHKLISYMEENRYSSIYVGKLRREINRIIAEVLMPTPNVLQ